MDKVIRQAVYIAFGVAIVLYLAQLFTPLRLDSDGIAYLSLADSASREGVFSAVRQTNFPFPKGYPAFVFLLMRAGIFSSPLLVISNLLLFAVALVFSFRTLIALGFQRSHATIACLLTLLSFAAVKHVTQGRSDFLFFALSACACWLMTVSSPYKWVALLPCIVCAIEVRFIGLALIAPLAVTAWPSVSKHRMALAAAAVVALGCMGVGIWVGHHYLASNFHIFKNNGPWRFVEKNVIAHSQDFGELVVNAPFSKLPSWSHGPMLIIGGAAWLLFFAGIAAVWRRSLWLAGYLIAYGGLIFPWPYTDPRFWLPAMPLVLLATHSGLMALFETLPRGMLVAYDVIFCALGFAALIYSTPDIFWPELCLPLRRWTAHERVSRALHNIN